MAQQTDRIPVPQTPHTRHRTKPCPFCAETIRYGAIKCRFCGEFLDGQRRPGEAKPGQNAPDAQGQGPPQDGAEDQNSGILWVGRPSVFALTWTFVKIACATALCWAVYGYPVTLIVARLLKSTVQVQQLAPAEAWIDLSALALGLGAVFALFWKLLALKSIRYEVTPDRIEWSRGIFDRKVDNLDMFRVIDLKLRRSLIDCLVGIGTVIVLTNDESDPQFEFQKIRRSRRLYDTLKEAGLKADRKRGVIHLE
ncbi:MAG: PH domain-containing protein [Sedimentisphaerales bacterium]|nr:PH domain-containing protein [Sedimentisphaerales bacterium]